MTAEGREVSPLKLGVKRQRRSTDFAKCIFCQTTQKSKVLSQASRVDLDSILSAVNVRRNELYYRLLEEFQTLDELVANDEVHVSYHRNCFQSYTS